MLKRLAYASLDGAMCAPMLSPTRDPEAFTDLFARCSYRAGGMDLGVTGHLPDHRQALAEGQRTGREGVADVVGGEWSASAAVVGVDLDVAACEIAGPDRRLAASRADGDLDQDLPSRHVAGDGCLVVARWRCAVEGDGVASHMDVEVGLGDRFSRLAHGHDDAAPVGVASGNGGLDQRRIGNCEADPSCRPGRLRAGDADLDELLRPFAILDDLMRKIEAEGVKGLAEGPSGCGSRRSVMAACWAWPVAKSCSVSLVEVSLSTVMALKERSAAEASRGWRTAAGSVASVNT